MPPDITTLIITVGSVIYICFLVLLLILFVFYLPVRILLIPAFWVRKKTREDFRPWPRRILVTLGFAPATLFIGFFAFFFVCGFRPDAPVTAHSPDGTKEALLYTNTWGIDRNTRLTLKEPILYGLCDRYRAVYTGPDWADDEVTGSERILWSKDGKHLLVLRPGIAEGGKLYITTGESVYLWYSLEAGKRASTMPNLSFADLAPIDFTEKVEKGEDIFAADRAKLATTRAQTQDTNR